jgi:hypothetical protein
VHAVSPSDRAQQLDAGKTKDGEVTVAAIVWGGDPARNAALFAMSARADMDNGGLTLREPMPDWLVTHEANGNPPTTQDLVDICAFMKTQTH